MKFVIAFLVGGILGTAFGAGAGIFFYPFLFPPPAAMDQLAAGEGETLVARGSFIHADSSDPVHFGSGGVEMFEDVVFLGRDFKVGPGPKYHVYLVPEEAVTPETEVDRTMYVDLGRLRSFEGSQRYPIPPGLDLAAYKSVVIWCEHFGVLISPARLTFQAQQ